MNPINMRLYRRFDADLIALNEMGIYVNVLAEILLVLYARGKHVRILPDKCEPFDINEKKCIHLSVNVRPEAVDLVRQIKRGYRNQFCKSLVRDALLLDPLWPFLTKQMYLDEENRRIQEHAEDAIVLTPLMRKKDYRMMLLGDTSKKKEESPKEKKETTPKQEHRQETKQEEKSTQAPPDPAPASYERKSKEEELREKAQTTHMLRRPKPKIDEKKVEEDEDEYQDFMDSFEQLF